MKTYLISEELLKRITSTLDDYLEDTEELNKLGRIPNSQTVDIMFLSAELEELKELKVKDLVKFMLLPSVVVVYDENQNYLAWITKKLDENHKVLQTVRERLVGAFGDHEIINVVPRLDDFHGIVFDFYIKTEK